jgi:hypothetical protein
MLILPCDNHRLDGAWAFGDADRVFVNLAHLKRPIFE